MPSTFYKFRFIDNKQEYVVGFFELVDADQRFNEVYPGNKVLNLDESRLLQVFNITEGEFMEWARLQILSTRHDTPKYIVKHLGYAIKDRITGLAQKYLGRLDIHVANRDLDGDDGMDSND